VSSCSCFPSFLFSFTDLIQGPGQGEGVEGEEGGKNEARKNYGAVPVLVPYLHTFLVGRARFRHTIGLQGWPYRAVPVLLRHQIWLLSESVMIQ